MFGTAAYNLRQDHHIKVWFCLKKKNKIQQLEKDNDDQNKAQEQRKIVCRKCKTNSRQNFIQAKNATNSVEYEEHVHFVSHCVRQVLQQSCLAAIMLHPTDFSPVCLLIFSKLVTFAQYGLLASMLNSKQSSSTVYDFVYGFT